MAISVLLFASYADAFGTRRLSVPIDAPCTSDALVAAMRTLPGGHVLPTTPMIAVNHHWIDAAVVVQGDDEVAVIPPVAGG